MFFGYKAFTVFKTSPNKAKKLIFCFSGTFLKRKNECKGDLFASDFFKTKFSLTKIWARFFEYLFLKRGEKTNVPVPEKQKIIFGFILRPYLLSPGHLWLHSLSGFLSAEKRNSFPQKHSAVYCNVNI